jgi:peptidoglycan/LPS O-acetylase OafA/YrhL
MNKPFSIYLDLVRFVAACLVYLYHSNQRWLISDILPASNYGHSSVIVFFVLSGFVIAYITDTREKQFSTYAASRISRIYSVAIPAIFLTIMLDSIGRIINSAAYGFPYDQFFIRIFASLFLLNEVWLISITSFSNLPYWSICYEMWYYVAYAIIVFSPRRISLLVIVLLGIILGPKIILLAPIWTLGVTLYSWKNLNLISNYTAWLMLLTSLIGIYTFHHENIPLVLDNELKKLIGDELFKEMTFSNHFLSDYILAILVFFNFTAMRLICRKFANILSWLEKPIRFFASYTLTLYLTHYPLFLFWGSILEVDPHQRKYWWMTTVLVALSVFCIGSITENRRHVLKSFLEKRLQRFDVYTRNHYASM